MHHGLNQLAIAGFRICSEDPVNLSDIVNWIWGRPSNQNAADMELGTLEQWTRVISSDESSAHVLRGILSRVPASTSLEKMHLLQAACSLCNNASFKGESQLRECCEVLDELVALLIEEAGSNELWIRSGVWACIALAAPHHVNNAPLTRLLLSEESNTVRLAFISSLARNPRLRVSDFSRWQEILRLVLTTGSADEAAEAQCFQNFFEERGSTRTQNDT